MCGHANNMSYKIVGHFNYYTHKLSALIQVMMQYHSIDILLIVSNPNKT